MPRTSILVSVGLLFLIGCASESRIRSHERGLISQRTAEAVYKAIYRAHQAGSVSDDVLKRTDEAYAEWQAAQRLYLTSVEAGVPDSPELTAGVRQSLRDLLRLAGEAGVL